MNIDTKTIRALADADMHSYGMTSTNTKSYGVVNTKLPPATVIAMCDEIERLEKICDAQRSSELRMQARWLAAQDEIERLHKEVERLQPATDHVLRAELEKQMGGRE